MIGLETEGLAGGILVASSQYFPLTFELTLISR
jgi:hypothetical protein